MKPYCGERSIEFLCDYVNNWIIVLDMMNNNIKNYYNGIDFIFNIDFIKEFVLKMTLVTQAHRNLYR
jgi:hypothetical protein